MTDSSLGTLTIRPAREDELGLVMAIYDDAAQWLHSKGIHYWAYPQPQWIWDLVGSDIGKGYVFLGCTPADSRAVGTIRVLWSDPEVWPEDAGEAGYVHGLAIRSEVRGHGVGAAMLEWAKGHIRAHGKKYVRLDCEAANPLLRRYYERLGFAFRREVRHGDYVGACYEMTL